MFKNEGLNNRIISLKKDNNISDFSKQTDKLLNSIITGLDTILSHYMQNILRVSCFSSETKVNYPANLPMWYHYADRYRGICIEYDMTKFDEKSVQRLFMFPIKYILSNFLNYENIKKNFAAHRFLLPFYKNKYWSYENEWRFISGFSSLDDVYKVPSSNNKYNSYYIKSIYIGYKASKKLIKNILYLSRNKYNVYIMNIANSGVTFDKCQ